MFCTNDRCSIPVHTLITDTIESCGGSTQLVRTLNRLGVCSSADTLARAIQYRVKERENRGPEHDCVPNAITIISADNIDFLHSYAQVFVVSKQVAGMEQLCKLSSLDAVLHQPIIWALRCKWERNSHDIHVIQHVARVPPLHLQVPIRVDIPSVLSISQACWKKTCCWYALTVFITAEVM